MKIGIFDSGKGGTSTLAEIKSLLPDLEYLYLADTKNCPYGEKSDDELYPIVTANVEKLINWGAKIIVIACNTVTTRYIGRLREAYKDIYFIGTEPAIKLATTSDAKNILILATPNTIKSSRLKNLIEKNQKTNQSIKLLACPGLAEAIEKNAPNLNILLKSLFNSVNKDNQNPVAPLNNQTPITPHNQNQITPLDNQNNPAYDPDLIVLGCTHYCLIKPDIQTFFPHAKLLDGNAGVAKRVKFIVENWSEK
ncbi:MAG: aspartate/glutamate racemase family protein [Candidatus Saccharibacteria bacterium]|nr:aspartate/glutamate racemase family protein [Candidatus Saccharibacteria bacterium]